MAIFVFYQSGVRQAGQPPQTVGEPVGEMKVPPPAEAQPQDPAAGLQIYKEDQGAAGHPQFAAPPEQPLPRAAPPAVVIAPPVGAPTTPVTAGPALRPAIAPPPAPAAQAAPKATVAQLPPAVKAPPPPVAKAPPAPPAKTPAAAPAPAARSGGAVVQIGPSPRRRSPTRPGATPSPRPPAWAPARARASRRSRRTAARCTAPAVTGFASREAAVAFCDKLKAAGKSCFVR